MVTIPQIRTRLLEVFPEKQADVLAHVVIEAHDDLVNQADFHALTCVVKEIAESQKELAESQKELAESQKELAESQKELNASLKNLSDSQEGLAEAQKQTEFALANLAKQMGGLSQSLGGSLEDFACELVPEMLEKYWRLVVISARPEDIEADRTHREIDVVVRGTIDDRPVTILCEVKAAVSASEVVRFLKIVQRVRAAQPTDDIRPLFFGFRADRKAREAITSSGAAMVFTRGVIFPAA